jgi:hypothetical protein
MRNRALAIAAAALLVGGLGATPASAVESAPAIVSHVQGVRCPHRIEVCHLYQWWDAFKWFPGRYCECYGPYIP